jgi:hypothetical protein
MTTLKKFMLLSTCALALGACSTASSLLNNKSAVPQAQQINVGNPLAMPPDLQLAVPTQTSDVYQANPGNGQEAADAGLNMAKPVQPAKPVQQASLYSDANAAPAKQDIYEQYGISKVKANGTAKTKEELQAELKLAIIAKKRQANPNYGTIKNIGAIFSDQ